MANKTEELNVDLTIKQVSSGDVLKDMEENDQLGANQIIVTENDTEVPMMPVGSIFVSAIPLDDARVRLLNGSTISQTGVYETFANLIKTLEASGQPITCTQTQFDEDVRLTGNCGKFVIDNDAGTIRLPKITTFIQGLSNISNIGSSLSAGLPNIEGYFSGRPYGGTSQGALTSQVSGAFSYTLQSAGSSSYSGVALGSLNAVPDKVSFNANSGATTKGIYGNSTTVQPNATRYPYYIVLASGYKSSQVVDIDNIMNDVNRISAEVEDKLPLSGGTLTGSIRLNHNLFDYRNVPTRLSPSNGSATNDVANKTITMTASSNDQYATIHSGLQLKPNTIYTFSMSVSPSNANIEIYVHTSEYGYVGRSGTYLTFITGASGYVSLIRIDNNASGATTTYSKFMLSEGSVILPYDEYKGKYLTETDATDYVVETRTTGSGYLKIWKSGFKEWFGNVQVNGEMLLLVDPVFRDTNYQVICTPNASIDDTVTLGTSVVKAVDAFKIISTYHTGPDAHGHAFITVMYYAFGY